MQALLDYLDSSEDIDKVVVMFKAARCCLTACWSCA